MGWDWRRIGLVREAGAGIWEESLSIATMLGGQYVDGQHAGQLGGHQGAAVEACLLGSVTGELGEVAVVSGQGRHSGGTLL